MQAFMRFPGFLTRACTLSYDDGVEEDKRLVEIMRKYGLKGTFNLNSKNLCGLIGVNSRTLSSDEIKEFFGDDTEIAIHGYNHHSLARVSTPHALRDVIADRDNLEKTFGRVVRGMAYANGSYDEGVVEILRSAGVVYARTVKSTYGFDLPDEWLTLHPTCHHKDPRLFELVEEFLKEPESKRFWTQKPKLFYLWGHSYEFPRDNNWDVIEKFGAKMAERNDIWHATNMEVYKYVQAFNNLVFSLDFEYVENPSAIDVYIHYKNTDILARAGKTTKLG